MKTHFKRLSILLSVLMLSLVVSGCPDAGTVINPEAETTGTESGTEQPTESNPDSSGDSGSTETVTAKVTVTYDANGGETGSVPVDTAEYSEDDSVTILGNAGSLEKAGSIFAGWCTTEDGRGTVYKAEETLTAGVTSIVLYARWIDWQKVTASSANLTSGMFFGESAALSDDGSVALIGASEDDEQGIDSGAVYVFERIDGSFTQTDVIYAPDAEAGDTFGYSVDISGDGTIALIGATKVDGDEDGSLIGIAGAVYLFRFENSTWTYKYKLTLENQTDNDEFGNSVAISSDGNTIALAASQKIYSGWDYGCIYVYTSDDDWTTEPSIKLLDRDESLYFGYLGRSLDISANGSRIIAGAPDDEMVNYGSVIVFDTIDNWNSFTEKSIQSADYAEEFGSAVSCSEDGKTLCIGAPCDENEADTENTGSVFVYKEVSGSWELQQKLYHTSLDPGNDYFGNSLGLSGDGTQMIGGAVGYINWDGMCSLFELGDTRWRESMIHQDPDGDEDYEFGHSSVISSDGSTIIVTSPYSKANNQNQAGCAFIYTLKK